MDKLLVVLTLGLPGVLSTLPSTFTVTSYDVQLTIPSDLNALVNGSVTIVLTCVSNTSVIGMHWGSSLTPTTPTESDLSIEYTAPGQAAVAITGFKTAVDAANQLTINTTGATGDTFAATGTVTINATFQTKVNADNKGLFYRQYMIGDTNNNTVLLTNLRPTFARELFPCLDEPQFSGLLTLTLIYPSSWSTAATSTVKNSTTSAGVTTTVFNPQQLPANAFAFFLAENMTQMNSSVSRSTTQLSFWGRANLDSSNFSAIVRFLSDYYFSIEDLSGINLNISHLTIVMVPGLEEPFAGYGVIFIREDNYAQEYSTPQVEGLFKTIVAPVIYQYLIQFTEFSCQYGSWSDYWVSQAIAKYLQYLVLNTVMPIFDFKTDLEVVARQTALYLDSQLDAKPLQDTENTTFASFVQALVNDPLKSLKGAALLNMLDQSLPSGAVFTAIKSFLVNNQGKTITSQTFISELQNITSPMSTDARQSLTSLATWFNSTEYPLVSVKVFKSGSPGSVNLTVAGYCSVLNPSCSTSLPNTYYVSVTVGSKSDNRYYTPRQDIWVTSNEAYKITNITVQDNDWVVANMKSGGYYRASYDEENWERIISALSSADQNLLDRTQLMDDGFALPLSSTDALAFNITLRLALANLGNNMYRYLVPVHRGLRGIRDNLIGLDISSSYKDFAAGFFLNLDRFLQNRSSDAFEKARIQALFLEDMCEYDVSTYRVMAVGNLTALLKGSLPNTVPSSAYDALVCCGARYNSSLKAQTLWNILADSTLNYYSRRFASVALGCLSNYTDIAQFFNTMTQANIQLKPYVQMTLENVADKNPIKFLANFTLLAEKFQAQLGAASVASLISRAGRKVNNKTQIAVLDGLDTNNNIDPVVKNTVQVTKDIVDYKVTWLSKNNASLVKALQSHTLPSGSSGANFITATSLLLVLPALLFTLTPNSTP